MARSTLIDNGKMTSALDANGMRIVHAGTPIADGDVATKKYVDDHGGGGGTGDYNELENKPSIDGTVLEGDLDSEMIGLAKTGYVDGQIANLGEVVQQYYNEFILHKDNENNPHAVTASQVGAYTTDQVDSKVDSAKTELNSRIDLIEATSRPNMNIVGSPTFREGNVSGFSANDYLMFPTQVNVGKNEVNFYMSFTTGPSVTTQQNLLDSWCGLALAIIGGNIVLAVSSNGTEFNTDRSIVSLTPNYSYMIRVSFDYDVSSPNQYTARVFVGDFASPWCSVSMDDPLFPTATYWGGANPQSGVNHIFGGTINLNECRMVWNGTEVWRGYDELPTVKFDPTATPRLDTAEKIVGVIEDAVSLNNRFLVNGTTAAIQTRTDETAEWTDEIRVDKGYDAVQGSTMVKLDKSVQNITVASSSLSIVLPEETRGTVRDLCLYVNNNSGADCALVFPAGTYYGDNPNGAVAKDGGVTAVYITEMPVGSWMLRISELEQFTVEATT